MPIWLKDAAAAAAELPPPPPDALAALPPPEPEPEPEWLKEAAQSVGLHTSPSPPPQPPQPQQPPLQPSSPQQQQPPPPPSPQAGASPAEASSVGVSSVWASPDGKVAGEVEVEAAAAAAKAVEAAAEARRGATDTLLLALDTADVPTIQAAMAAYAEAVQGVGPQAKPLGVGMDLDRRRHWDGIGVGMG